MKKLVIGLVFVLLLVMVAIVFAHEPDWRGGSMMGHGVRGGGYGMGPDAKGCWQAEQGRGGMMGIGRERMGYLGYHRRWFHHGVTLMLHNADKLGLTDEQIKKLNKIERKYSKDIIKQDAESKIAEIDLAALLKGSEINLPEVKKALKKVENSEMQIRYLRIMAFVEAKNLLTDEQKNSLNKLMERPGPRMRGIMSLPEPEEEVGATEEGQEETPE